MYGDDFVDWLETIDVYFLVQGCAGSKEGTTYNNQTRGSCLAWYNEVKSGQTK